MIRFLLLFSLLLSSASAEAGPLVLTLPSADSYCYWVQSKAGPVGTMPVTITHRQKVQISAPVTAGDRLYVMDAHSGEVASHPVALGPNGSPLPVSVVMADFQPISTPAPAPSAAPATLPVTSPGEPEKENSEKTSGVTRLLTGLFSLLLAGGVAWLVLHLVRTRGEPLRDAARRMGVEVADPAALVREDEAAPPVYAPVRRALEVVPEEAGLAVQEAASAARLGRGPELSLSDIPALLGLQGLAAGSTFALTDGDVTVGRDGDNGIVLAENTVSRRHARLLRDGQGQFVLTDLGSANGVYINGTRVQRAVLSTGDEIKIGDNYFRFQAARGTQ